MNYARKIKNKKFVRARARAHNSETEPTPTNTSPASPLRPQEAYTQRWWQAWPPQEPDRELQQVGVILDYLSLVGATDQGPSIPLEGGHMVR